MTFIGDAENKAGEILHGAEHEASMFVHATGSELVKLYHEVLGSEGYDAMVTAAKSLLKQKAGEIIRRACALAEASIKDGVGAAMKAAATAFSLSALQQAGISVTEALLNLAIELVVNGGKVGVVAALTA